MCAYQYESAPISAVGVLGSCCWGGAKIKGMRVEVGVAAGA